MNLKSTTNTGVRKLVSHKHLKPPVKKDCPFNSVITYIDSPDMIEYPIDTPAPSDSENPINTPAPSDGGDPATSNARRGRPRKYASHSEYVRSCNAIAKFKTMTFEKASRQIKRYNILINEINAWIENKK